MREKKRICFFSLSFIRIRQKLNFGWKTEPRAAEAGLAKRNQCFSSWAKAFSPWAQRTLYFVERNEPSGFNNKRRGDDPAKIDRHLSRRTPFFVADSEQMRINEREQMHMRCFSLIYLYLFCVVVSMWLERGPGKVKIRCFVFEKILPGQGVRGQCEILTFRVEFWKEGGGDRISNTCRVKV